MRRVVLSLLCASVTPVLAAQDVVVEKNLEARMRDGVVLRADVYRPRTDGRRPALLQRTPYSKNPQDPNSQYHRLARAGFVVVVQDTRGRYMSEGVAIPHDEGADGYDTVEWVAQLPWVDGRVGMFGGSYSATTQLLAAPLRPPHLVALFPSASYASRYDMVFQGGAFYLMDGLSWNLGQAQDVKRRQLEPGVNRDGELGMSAAQRRLMQEEWLRALPLRTVGGPQVTGDPAAELRRYSPGYFDMLAHPSFDDWWGTFDVAARHPQFQVPAYHLTGWYDALLTGTLRNFSGLRQSAGSDRARSNQRLIVGPWTHARPTAASTRIGDVAYGPAAGFNSESLIVAWFRHWMPAAARAGARVEDFPVSPVRLFVMGENRWRDEDAWPLARARATPWYLASDGTANSSAGNGRLGMSAAVGAPIDTFTYDPDAPVPTGSSGAYSRAPHDMREVERRADVLVYSSAPLTASIEVTGYITLHLWITSSALDTDFTARLVDVHPDGTARALTDGIQRARYRKSRTTPELLTPGQPTEVTIEVGATSNVFLPGHRIRLEVSSSNFPRYDRNPNTGEPFGASAKVERARQVIHHDARYPSRLVLPVIPR
ncbi:MAG: CocE/NonD family hydrolase [Gemmatimonadetes bacterium]|nr:CocE/NonD family hydrolase [Gemmatimonadota bacterium]